MEEGDTLTSIENRAYSKQAHYVLLSCLVMVLMAPVLLHLVPAIANFLIDALLVVIVLAGVSVVSEEYSRPGPVRIVMMIALASSVLNAFTDAMPIVQLIVKGVSSSFLIFLTIILIKRVINIRKVSVAMLIHAMSGYLLLGFSGSIIISLANRFVSNPYSVEIREAFGAYGEIYYSFVTLTTLGYGDIYPTHPFTQALAIFIAISGVFYMGFLVGALIGAFISEKQKS
jgi:hypothetical protein